MGKKRMHTWRKADVQHSRPREPQGIGRPEMELLQLSVAGDQVSDLVAKTLMEKYYPTYPHDLLGSRFIPQAVLGMLQRVLPDQDFDNFVMKHCQNGTEGHKLYPDDFSVKYERTGCRPILCSCCVDDLSKNKKAMVVLYQLVATEDVGWEYSQDFVNYVHFLEGIQMSTQVDNVLVDALMHKYFPTYQHDLTGSRLLPEDVFDKLKCALPDKEFSSLMFHQSEVGIRGFPIACGKGPRSYSVRELCKYKRVMAVLYQLVTMEQVAWEHGLDFMNYVHLLEGIEKSTQVNNLVTETLMKKYFPMYQHELTGSKFVPQAVLCGLKNSLPDEIFSHFMKQNTEKGTADIHHHDGSNVSHLANFAMSSENGFRRCRIRQLCENKQVMAVLYQLIATNQITWEEKQAFGDFVHVLEGIKK